MICKKCGKEIDETLKFCPHCGETVCKKKVKKPAYKKWWFWLLMALATILTIVIISPSDTDSDFSGNDNNTSQTTQSQKDKTESEKTIEYEKVDLKTMMDELDSNALKAENKYQDKYVEVVGEITNFDSDGSYISIEPVNADDWNFDTVLCKIKNDNQLDYLLEKKKGDKVTIKGQIVSIGELLGYTIKIDEVY